MRGSHQPVFAAAGLSLSLSEDAEPSAAPVSSHMAWHVCVCVLCVCAALGLCREYFTVTASLPRCPDTREERGQPVMERKKKKSVFNVSSSSCCQPGLAALPTPRHRQACGNHCPESRAVFQQGWGEGWMVNRGETGKWGHAPVPSLSQQELMAGNEPRVTPHPGMRLGTVLRAPDLTTTPSPFTPLVGSPS